MKQVVVYWSLTGNTKKVAEAIFESLSGEKMLASLSEVVLPEDDHLLFIGFPVMQFGPPPEVKRFVANMTPGKAVAVFITHAMPPNQEDPSQQMMLSKEIDRCLKTFSKQHMVGLFHCQGELSGQSAAGLRDSNIPMLQQFAAMRPLTLGHPGDEELAQARQFAREIAGCYFQSPV